MKKVVRTVCIALVIVLVLCWISGCTSEVSSVAAKYETSMFVEVERTSSWRVVYHRETKVMYTVSCGGYDYGNFVLLVNADGTPMLYEG